MIRAASSRGTRAALSAVAGAGAVVGAQILLARRRAILLGHPLPATDVKFGTPGAPPLHFVVVGDSTAVGVGANNVEETYPWLVAEYLAQEFRVRLDVVGRAGARMSDLANQFAARAADLHPDLVLIGIGANDVTHLTPMQSVARNLSFAIAQIREGGADIVLALGPRFDPPILARPLRDFIRARARALNRTLRRIALAHAIPVIDLPVGLGDSFARDPQQYYSEDRYHPGPEGYALWAGVIRGPALDAAINRHSER